MLHILQDESYKIPIILRKTPIFVFNYVPNITSMDSGAWGKEVDPRGLEQWQ
jgi:hypothetical protein